MYCFKTGKLSFATATAAARSCARFNGNPYRCPMCGDWHATSGSTEVSRRNKRFTTAKKELRYDYQD